MGSVQRNPEIALWLTLINETVSENSLKARRKLAKSVDHLVFGYPRQYREYLLNKGNIFEENIPEPDPNLVPQKVMGWARQLPEVNSDEYWHLVQEIKEAVRRAFSGFYHSYLEHELPSDFDDHADAQPEPIECRFVYIRTFNMEMVKIKKKTLPKQFKDNEGMLGSKAIPVVQKLPYVDGPVGWAVMQFFETLTGLPPDSIRFCRFCKRAFLVTRKDKVFCCDTCGVKFHKKLDMETDPEGVKAMQREYSRRWYRKHKMKDTNDGVAPEGR